MNTYFVPWTKYVINIEKHTLRDEPSSLSGYNDINYCHEFMLMLLSQNKNALD